MWSLHVLPVSAWVSSGCSGFLPQYKDVQVRWIGHAKLPLSVRGTIQGECMGLWGWGLGGIVVSADSMGRMASFCTVGIRDHLHSTSGPLAAALFYCEVPPEDFATGNHGGDSPKSVELLGKLF